MAGPVVRIEGTRELSKAFRDAGGSVKELSGAYRKIAQQLLPPAQREAPRGPSGRLSASTKARGQRTRAILSAGSRAVPYAGPIHFGNPSAKTYPTHKTGARRSSGTLGVIRPNPWLYRTADVRRDEVAQAFEDNVGTVLRRYGLTSPL